MVDVHSGNETVSINVRSGGTSTSVSADNSKAKYYADLAAASATSAATSATNASNSATSATSSASTATTKATEASNSATTATTKASEATTSATNAATSEDNAEIWAEGTDAQVQTLGGTHSSKGWVDYVMENAPTATVTKSGTVSTLTVTDINGTTTTEINDGSKGDKGDTGAKGDTGTAATISVGTTTTGDAGTQASVVNSGTSSAAILDFTIPRGDKGNKGDTGDDGYSPTATVTKTGTVATITITDKTGTTTANVYDGSGSVDDVKVNGTSVVTAGVANIDLTGKQDTLVSGTNIKTINSNSILGSGNVDIDTLPSQSGQSGKYLTTNGTTASWDIVDALPSQSGQSGKFLTTDGTDASWGAVDALPSQTGQSGKYLTTDGSSASWGTVSTGLSGLSDVQITSIANNDILIYNSTDSKFENLNANPMITSYVNGTSGYNIWSNGYCEQWGITSGTSSYSTITISLMKAYSNTNYIISICAIEPVGNFTSTTTGTLRNTDMDRASSLTTSSFITGTYSSNMWKTSGYLASSSDSSSSGGGVIGGNDDPFG